MKKVVEKFRDNYFLRENNQFDPSIFLYKKYLYKVTNLIDSFNALIILVLLIFLKIMKFNST